MYTSIGIDPSTPNEDGGQPGSNIRNVYMYREDRVSLAETQKGLGSPTDSQEVIMDNDGKVNFMYNPGKIDSSNTAWSHSRKPLAAAFEFRGERYIYFV